MDKNTPKEVRKPAKYLCEYCHASEKWQYVQFTIDHIILLHCIMSSPNFPIIGGGITALWLALMLGNPFIAILAGTLLGVILNIPFVQQFLQFMCK